MWIFDCTGVGAPNPHCVQGATVFTYINIYIFMVYLHISVYKRLERRSMPVRMPFPPNLYYTETLVFKELVLQLGDLGHADKYPQYKLETEVPGSGKNGTTATSEVRLFPPWGWGWGWGQGWGRCWGGAGGGVGLGLGRGWGVGLG